MIPTTTPSLVKTSLKVDELCASVTEDHVLNVCLIFHTKFQNLGPGRTGQIFVYFAKKSVTSSLRQVHPVIFRSTKFCQGLPNFKDAVALPRSRTNFCQS